ncbi:hypothetical protein [Eleftheria terrae]|uniref:hypothetical protein n=1 Tax=Eleftheria terrae TaxID=1597781 RepID=UPI00263B60B3|nr:hypothetical protein [Eleftheria terrae]WKB53025.1 hypothetical protein N7L95_01060 [Eleftheria terrae]
MFLFLKTFVVILGMTLIIPLAVAAGSGSWRTAWRAWKEYVLFFVLPCCAITATAALVALIERL